MEDLDHILLDQLHSKKKNIKTINRLKKMLKDDKELIKLERQVKLKIQFYEEMVQDKNLLRKKIKKKKTSDPDLLSRNIFYIAYRNTMMFAMFGSKIVFETMQNYISLFKKDKNEKTK